MSDGMYEAFAPRNQPKEIKINKYVKITVYSDSVFIENTKSKTNIPLKKRTLKKIMKEIK